MASPTNSNLLDDLLRRHDKLLKQRDERRRIAAQKRRAWTVAYWERTKADPELYKQHCAKVSDGFLRQRMKGKSFFKKKKKVA